MLMTPLLIPMFPFISLPGMMTAPTFIVIVVIMPFHGMNLKLNPYLRMARVHVATRVGQGEQPDQ
jgi:hypothetical protein